MARQQRPPIEDGLALDAYAQSSDSGRRRVPAWLLSALLHASLLVLAALLVPAPSGGVRVEPPRSGGIVLVRQTRGAAEYFDEQAEDEAASAAARSTADQASPDAAASLPSAAELPVDPAGLLPATDALGGLGLSGELADALPSAGALTTGVGPDRRLGKSAQTYVFGAQGEGTAFVYVFDRSDSMNGFEGRPLAASKAELIKSLGALQATHQFHIIFYNTEVTAFHPSASQSPGVIFATDQNKALAAQFVRQVPASGGTRHVKPLSLALRLAPDVIFFLTDAGEPELSAADLQSLRRLNAGTVIHAIEFGAGPNPGGENFLTRLARQNEGQHVYVDVTTLPRF
jgi:hypothetical protein